MSKFLEGLFRSYYRRTLVPPPFKIEMREFGFQLFGSQGMIRHIAFASGEELNKYLREHFPRHAYYSTALYEYPSAPDMSEKGWKGAEMVFDIDVDHIPTPCKELHDRWRCADCGAEGWGQPPRCPRCGSERLERESWVCDMCISVARDEILKLVDFLEKDFGINRAEMKIYFSGHRGFHLHIETEKVLTFDQDVRREIADYVRGVGLQPELLLRPIKGGRYSLKHGIDAPGWPGRIAKYALLLLSERSNPGEVALPELTIDEWREVISRAVADLSVKIDEKVTIDTKRLIRLPWTLHGKTGLRVTAFSVDDLEALAAEEILRRAIVFGDEEVSVKMDRMPRRVLFYDIPTSSEGVRVPLFLAVYLHANGSAQVQV